MSTIMYPAPRTKDVVNPGSRLKAAFEKHESKIRNIPAKLLIPITFDVALAYTTSQGRLARIGTLRAEVAALPDINKQLIDELDERLLALGHALALYYSQTVSPDELEALVARVTAARQLLASDTAALAKRGLYPAERLVEVKGSVTRAVAGFDVLGMTNTMRESWDTLEGKTAVTPADLDAYDADADRMLVAIGERHSEELVRVTAVRDASVTYFAESWDELRRGVSYKRWKQGDVDDFVPTLFSNRQYSAKKTEQPEVEAPLQPSAPAVAKPAASVDDDDDGPFSS